MLENEGEAADGEDKSKTPGNNDEDEKTEEIKTEMTFHSDDSSMESSSSSSDEENTDRRGSGISN